MTQTAQSSATKVDNDHSLHWQTRLALACRQVHIDTACLGILQNGATVLADYGYPAHDNFLFRQHPAFCVTKLFAATATAMLVTQKKLNFADEIVQLLPMLIRTDPAAIEVLHGVTIAQLLSHSHGLDALEFDAAPVDDNGFINAAKVIAELIKTPRIFAPGKFYSYGMTGCILLGMIIEYVTQEPVGRTLHQILAKNADQTGARQPGDINASGSPHICPSSGTGLNLCLHDLLQFARVFLASGANEAVLSGTVSNEIFTRHQAMPGWSPTLAGCGLGWKCFGGHWYGQDGMDGRKLMYVRVNRVAGTAICLIAEADQRNPAVLPPLLFQHTYAELGFSKKRHPDIATVAPDDNYAALTGTYGNRFTRFTIKLADKRLTLDISSTTKTNATHPHRCYLYPAENNIFFLAKPWQYVTFLQLVHDDAARYLWDHTQMWRELG